MFKINGSTWWLRDGKNWVRSNTKVLVERFLTHPAQVICVSTTSASIVNHCFNLLNWNWSLSPMTFLMSLPSIFNSTISLNILGKSYKALLGLEMITDDNILKYIGQWPKLVQISLKQLVSSRSQWIIALHDRALELFFREWYPLYNGFIWNFF